MFKIFYKNKILLISNKEFEDKYFTKVNFFDEINRKILIHDFLTSDNSSNLNIFGADKKKIRNSILAEFKFVKAAGGLVFNEKQQVLIISRLGYLDLPKGKLMKNENSKQAAIREVSEECGIIDSDLELGKKIASTYHIYKLKHVFVLKKTIWFKIKFSARYKLTAQKQENIEQVFWCNIKDIPKIIDKTYASLRDVFLSISKICH